MSCYKECENDPECAAVYAYNGPEMGGSVECSYVNADNVPKLYDRYGSMTRFNPNARHVFVNKTKKI